MGESATNTRLEGKEVQHARMEVVDPVEKPSGGSGRGIV